jgi:hypothetical protein
MTHPVQQECQRFHGRRLAPQGGIREIAAASLATIPVQASHLPFLTSLVALQRLQWIAVIAPALLIATPFLHRKSFNLS